MRAHASAFGLKTWVATVLASAILSACGSLRHSERPSTPANPPPVVSVDPTPPPVSDSPPIETNNEVRTDASAPAGACTCAEVKPKPKPRPKPKPVRKEAPPQLPTAPIVEETPRGEVIDAQVKAMNVSVMSILGKKVQGPNKEDLGRVVDVLADDTGRVRVAIIDFGGFLGVGNHRIAVDWPLLRFNPDANDPSLLLSVSREKLQNAPEYKDNPRPQTLMEPAAPASPTPSPESKQ